MKARGRQLIRDLQAQGYTLTQVSNGHLLVHRPDGTVLRHPDGRPMTIAWSPSCPRADLNARSALRRMGALQ
jgi:hypothetical protein